VWALVAGRVDMTRANVTRGARCMRHADGGLSNGVTARALFLHQRMKREQRWRLLRLLGGGGG
jgi:hypothetical protein